MSIPSNIQIFVINNKMGLIGQFPNKSEILAQPIYDVIFPFLDGYAIVKRNAKYGLIDEYGNETIPTIYEGLNPVVENNHVTHYHGFDESLNGYDVDSHNNTYHNYLLDIQNEISALEKKKCSIKPFQQTKDIVPYSIKGQSYKDKIQLVFNVMTKKRFRVRMYSVCANNVHGDRIAVINGQFLIFRDEVTLKEGLMDFNGNIIIRPIYDTLLCSKELENTIYCNCISAQIKDKWGYVDFSGNTVIPFDYDFATEFTSQGLAAVKLNKKWGVIDHNNNIIVPLTHSEVDILSNRTIAYCDYSSSNCDFTIINPDTRSIQFQTKLHGIERLSFEEFPESNYVRVHTLRGTEGVIDKKGNIIIPFIYSWIDPIDNKRLRAAKNGKLGIINYNNVCILPFEFDSLYLDGNGYIVVQKGVYFGILDLNLNEILPIKYDSILYSKLYKCALIKMGCEQALFDCENQIFVVPFTKQNLAAAL